MTGEINKEILDAVLNTLPVEISFVGENDTVRCFINKYVQKHLLDAGYVKEEQGKYNLTDAGMEALGKAGVNV